MTRFLAPAFLALTLLPACSSSSSAPVESSLDSGLLDSPIAEPDSSLEASPDADTALDSAMDSASIDVSPDTNSSDSSSSDSSSSDSSSDSSALSDASEASLCAPLSGLGTVTCPCGKPNDLEWNATNSPFYFDSLVDLGTAGWDATQLTPGAKTINDIPNLGGKSVKSEALAFEMLARCDFAKLIKTESQITYDNVGGKKTDVLVLINGRKVGVSVVRAHNYNIDYFDAGPYSSNDALHILEKKLGDIPLSAANATVEDAWERSILAVIADDQDIANVVKSTWESLDATLRGNVILYVTVTNGYDHELYYDQ